jgi:hypothetical protein
MDLLERDVQLGTLDGALKTAAAGHGRVALVSGEAGIGKTSVAEHSWSSAATSAGCCRAWTGRRSRWGHRGDRLIPGPGLAG